VQSRSEESHPKLISPAAKICSRRRLVTPPAPCDAGRPTPSLTSFEAGLTMRCQDHRIATPSVTCARAPINPLESSEHADTITA
jgi:hypothetical protein